MNRFAYFKRSNRPIDGILLRTVDQAVGSFTGDTNNVSIPFYKEGVRTVGHACFHRLKLFHFRCPAKPA